MKNAGLITCGFKVLIALEDDHKVTPRLSDGNLGNLFQIG